MSSLIHGYNYDVFISYRQKDNKGDQWVSKFVESLKTELEATFKEEVSVYFDENLQDRLQETHHVNKSLEGKLKCVIFIPILSQTYCDPNSYAWQHEFLSFLRFAESDSFGRDVTLRSGNVASRILPVRIHDLEEEDIKLYEVETGSVMRAMDFVFKTASGVNRPLIANEEHPHDNLNKTFYNDQINKVAQAVKEIITALKQPVQKTGRMQDKQVIENPSQSRSRISKIITGSIIALLLIAAGLIFIPELFKSSSNLEKSIAVLPFRNDSADQENSAFINGLMDKTLSNLQMIKGLRVISRTSVEQYRGHDKPIPEIAKELGVNYIVEGSGQRIGNNYSLTVQLIKADKKEDHLWAESYEQEINEADGIFTVQSEIAETIAKELEVNLTAEEKQLIDKIPTRNLTALDFYQTGIEELRKYQSDIYNLPALDRAEDFLKKAQQYDPAFAEVYLALAQVYSSKHAADQSENYLDSILVLVNTTLSYDPDLAVAYLWRGNYYNQIGYPEKALEEFDKAIDINPSLWQAYTAKAAFYRYTDPLEAIKNMHEALAIARGPELAGLLGTISWDYCWAGFPEIWKMYSEKIQAINDDSISYFARLSHFDFFTGNLEESVYYYKKVLESSPRNLLILFHLGQNSSFIGNYEEAQVYIDKWLENLDQTLVASLRVSGMYRVGYIYWKNGRYDEANYYFDLQLKYSNNQINSNLPLNQGVFPYYDRAGVYAFRGEKEKAYEDLRIFNQRPVIPIYIITLLKYDSLFDSIRDEPEFQQIIRDNEAKFQAEHEKIRKWLEENDPLTNSF